MLQEDPIVDLLKCSVCTLLPRKKRVYTCEECGNLLCLDCSKKMYLAVAAVSCPMCRSSKMHLNKHAERLLGLTRSRVKVNCQYDVLGCKAVGLAHNIGSHEESCKKRTVGCPSKHRGACQWEGKMGSPLVRHIMEGKCTLTFHKIFPGKPANFRAKDTKVGSVLGSKKALHWIPSMTCFMVDGEYEPAYICLSREPNGLWMLKCRSYSSRSVRDRIKVTLSASSENQAGSGDNVSYTGKLNCSSLSTAEVHSSGNLLYITDNQVRAMKSDVSLFRYNVTFNLDA